MPHAIDDRLARRNALVLGAAQAVGGAMTSITIALGGLVGVYLSPERPELATVPVTSMVVGTAAGTVPAALILERIGRRGGFMAGALVAAMAGAIAFTAIHEDDFTLYCVGTFLSGFAFAFVQQYRFAAAEGASDAYRPKAISYVLAGGVFAGIVGPQTIIATKDWFLPVAYAGTYLAQVGLAAVSIVVLSLYRAPPQPPRDPGTGGGRPLWQIFTQPKVSLAVGCAAVAYAAMSLLMTAAPLAMIACGFSAAEAAVGIQWHVMAMFVPSFFTGHLITRFSAEAVTATGLLLLAVSGAAALLGITLGHFYVSLVLLGVGWNFGFIGGTAMLTATQRPEERARVQAANDFIVFGVVALASLSSGALFATLGWAAIALSVIPFVTLPFVLLALSGSRRGTARFNAG